MSPSRRSGRAFARRPRQALPLVFVAGILTVGLLTSAPPGVCGGQRSLRISLNSGEGGEPLRHVRVEVYLRQLDAAPGGEGMRYRGGAIVLRGTTGGDGSVSIGPVPAGPVALALEVPGWVTPDQGEYRFVEGSDQGDAELSVALHLAPEEPITGRVEQPPGATWQVMRLQREIGVSSGHEVWQTVRVAESGSFVIGGVARGTVLLRVVGTDSQGRRWVGFSRAGAGAGGVSFDLAAPREGDPALIEVRTVRPDASSADSDVLLVVHGPSVTETVFERTSAGAAVFEFPFHASTALDFHAGGLSDDGLGATERTGVPVTSTSLVIPRHPAREAKGRITGLDGLPAARAHVLARSAFMGLVDASATSDSGGTFKLDGLGDMEYVIEISNVAENVIVASSLLVPPQHASLERHLAKEHRCTVGLVQSLATTRALYELRVYREREGGRILIARGDLRPEAGAVIVGLDKAQRHELELWKGHSLAWRNPAWPPDDTTLTLPAPPVWVDPADQRAAAIRVREALPRDRGAPVTVKRSEAKGGLLCGNLDARGRASLTCRINPDDGPWDVWVGPLAGGRYAWARRVTFGVEPLELSLREGGEIRGRVVTVEGVGGEELANAFVFLTGPVTATMEPWPPPGAIPAHLDPETGTFTLQGVPAGRWDVHAMTRGADGKAYAASTTATLGDEDVTLTLVCMD